MRFRRAYKKPGEPGPIAKAAPPRPERLDVSSAMGNRAVARDLKGEGRPLPGSTRAQMEAALGGNFKDVRVHTGADAARQAQEAGATALTSRADVVFDRDQYQPGTLRGDALIAHELGHVMQQRGATTEGRESAALESDANKAALRGVSSLFGGMRSRLAGAGPVLRSGLAVQRCSCGGAQKAPVTAPGKAPANKTGEQKKPEDGSAAQGRDPLAAEKEAIASEFGFSRVADGDVTWKPAELAKVRRILGKMPPDGKSAIKGVALIRVSRPNCPGGDPAGCFRQSVNATTGDREDVIEIGDDAFSQDKDIEDNSSGVTVTRRDASGETIKSLPSEDVVAHEVGHAVESAPRRAAEAERFKADLAVTGKQDTLTKLANAFSNPPVAGISNASAAELKYQASLVAVNRALEPVSTNLMGLGDEPAAKNLKETTKSIKDLKPSVQKAIAARDKAKAALPAGSSAFQPTVEAGQDAALASIDDLVKALEERHAAQVALEKAEAAEAATVAKVPGEDGKIDTSRRLAEVVAIVALKNIDVKNSSALRDYPKDNWPDHPDELYAELFQMSITEPGGLRVFDADIAAYFQPPIGVKDSKLKKRVDAWIAKQKK
jgi:hypothetical protein